MVLFFIYHITMESFSMMKTSAKMNLHANDKGSVIIQSMFNYWDLEQDLMAVFTILYILAEFSRCPSLSYL